MANFDYDIGILGGGAAGLTVASGAARLGAKTLLIEKEKSLGGDCLHFGCVPSKTLIQTAHVYHLMKNAVTFGLPPVELKPVDFGEIARRIQGVIQMIQKHDSEERFCGLGVKVEFGEPAFEDEHEVRLGGKSISARNWAIATGSSAAIPPVQGLDETPYLTNRDLYSFEKLPESMVILGAGPIAAEMAQAFCRLGTRVAVIQRGSQILSNEDKDLADQVMENLTREGVSFFLKATILSVRNLGSQREVVIKKEDGQTLTLRAETLLVALGREANLKTLNLEGIGIPFEAKGLKLDPRLRTVHKHIYGAGDVTGSFQFTHAAGYEGSIVVSNAIFHLPRKTDYTFMPWCTYTHPELAGIGMNEKRAKEAGIPYSVYTEEFKDNDRSLAEGEEMGRIKMILNEREKPIGVQILGPRAGDLLGEWVAVLNGGVKISTLAAAVHPYPTLGEINKRVAGAWLSQKIFSEKIKKGLRFFFQLKGRACGMDEGGKKRMILESKGKIAEGLHAIGNPALPAFLGTGKTPSLFDAGMTFMGPTYGRDLQTLLGDVRRLRYLFITHSHYDHCGAAPYLKRKIPGLQIGASARAAEVWKRPNAIQMIQNLSKAAEENSRPLLGGENVLFDGLKVDLYLEDGTEIDLGEAERVKVLATPGHTRDAVSYYLPWIRTLICGEAVGTLNRDGSVRPQFLASDQDYLDSLEKLCRLDIDILIMAHLKVLTGDEVQNHLSRSILATVDFRRRIEKELAAANGNQQEAVEKISREDYEEKKIVLQEKRPYLINLTAQVKTIAEGR